MLESKYSNNQAIRQSSNQTILPFPAVPVDSLFDCFLYIVVQGGEEVATNALLQFVDRAGIVAQFMVLPIVVHHKSNG